MYKNKGGRPASPEKLEFLNVKVTRKQKTFLNRHGNMSKAVQKLIEAAMQAESER